MTFTVLKYIAFIPKWLRIFIMKGAVFCQIIFMHTLRWLCNFYSFVNVMLILQFTRSVMSDSVTPWIAAPQASLSITNSRSSPRLMSIESVMPFSHLILCRQLLLLPPIPPSIRVFSNESTLHMRLPKYWSFSFRISPSNEHPGLISFRMDWVFIGRTDVEAETRDWACTDHVSIMQCSRGWSCNDHVAKMYWSGDWSCNGNVIYHALITCLSCSAHVADPAMIT